MNTEHKVCSLEVSKKLHKMEVKQESEFYWENTVGQKDQSCWAIVRADKRQLQDKYLEYFSAFTFEELADIVEDLILACKGYQDQTESARECEDELQAECDRLKKALNIAELRVLELRGGVMRKQMLESKRGSVEMEIRVSSSFLPDELTIRLAQEAMKRFNEELQVIEKERALKKETGESVASQVARFVNKFKKRGKP